MTFLTIIILLRITLTLTEFKVQEFQTLPVYVRETGGEITKGLIGCDS